MKIPRYVVFLIVLWLFSVCCGQSDDKPITDKHQPQQITDAADEETTKSKHITNRAHYHTVEIKQMKFDPAELIVQKGDTVVWINNDMVIHDVTEQYAKEWTSSPIPLKESWQIVITQSSDYYCSLHVVMKGKIIVN
jgi:plastocyanin